MKIALFAHRTAWPPFKGSQVRSFNILKALAGRGHEVHFFAFTDDEPQRVVRELSRYAASVTLAPLSERRAKVRAALTLVGRDPLSVGYFRSRFLHRAARRFFHETAVDATVVHSSSMAQYVPLALRRYAVMDMTDVDSQKFIDYAKSSGNSPWSLIYRTEGKRLRRYELEALRDFGSVTLVTEQERELLARDTETELTRRILVINNGVDLDYFHPNTKPETLAILQEAIPAAERNHFRAGARRIVFTGAMDYQPNVEGAVYFATQVLPLIRQAEPAAEFMIVGSRPTVQVRALAALPGVRVTGFVQDVRPYLKGCDVCVVPLRYARGVQNKMLEAMASGCAIVTTPAAVAGVSAADGDEVVVTHDTNAFAAATLEFMRNPARRAAFGARARKHVERAFSWTPLMDRLVSLVEQHAMPPDSRSALDGDVAMQHSGSA
jgi:sugar transferase (PEP-CTERM/EpsH1 system associated)